MQGSGHHFQNDSEGQAPFGGALFPDPIWGRPSQAPGAPYTPHSWGFGGFPGVFYPPDPKAPEIAVPAQSRFFRENKFADTWSKQLILHEKRIIYAHFDRIML